jgi:hypothetical protein
MRGLDVYVYSEPYQSGKFMKNRYYMLFTDHRIDNNIQQIFSRNAPKDNNVKMVALSDKLSNIRAIYRDYQAIGDKVWDLFCVKDKASHEWHFRGLARALSSLKGTFAYDEFAETIEKVFKK